MCLFFKVEDDIDENASDMGVSQVNVSLTSESCSKQSIRKKSKGDCCDEVLDLVAKKLQSSSEGNFLHTPNTLHKNQKLSLRK